MLTFIGSAYVHGFIWGVTKKVTVLFHRNLFTEKEHELAQQTVGKLYQCKPIESVFSEDGIKKLQSMIETGDFRGMWKLARDEAAISDVPWCVSYVMAALNCLSMCLPDIVFKATTAYIYGEL
jgi:hypothetical protein